MRAARVFVMVARVFEIGGRGRWIGFMAAGEDKDIREKLAELVEQVPLTVTKPPTPSFSLFKTLGKLLPF